MSRMTAPVKVRAAEDLLYLAVDLGATPSIKHFGSQVTYLGRLSWFAEEFSNELYKVLREDGEIDVSHPMGIGVPYPSMEGENLKILRTSMASPWVTVITESAKAYAPVGIGFSALYGLHHLMKMEMQWQNHAHDLKNRRVSTDLLVKHIEALAEGRADGRTLEEFGVHESSLNLAANAISQLGKVTAAVMVDLDDPRVTGN